MPPKKKTPTAPGCICGHTIAVHPDTKCTTERCQCQVYIELCPQCSHSKPWHEQGLCNRITTKDRQPCHCTFYPAPATP